MVAAVSLSLMCIRAATSALEAEGKDNCATHHLAHYSIQETAGQLYDNQILGENIIWLVHNNKVLPQGGRFVSLIISAEKRRVGYVFCSLSS